MHDSVLLNESIKYLNIKEDGIYVDCTLGYAGHSKEILKNLKRGFLYSFDQDIEAIEYSSKKLQQIGSNFEIIKSNFVNIKDELNKRGVTKVDGILYDLGVSSPQLDNANRGFSYHQDARLDMRMDQNQTLDAHYVVNHYSQEDLIDILFKYGDEEFARSIVKNIIKARVIKDIDTTLELVEIIKSSVPEKKKRHGHPAPKTFQAIRIEVNKELEVLTKSLKDALELLNTDGRLCVITFHSKEDKITSDIFKDVTALDPNLKKLPIIPDEFKPKYELVKKIESSKQEIDENNRARSAKLRVIKKI